MNRWPGTRIFLLPISLVVLALPLAGQALKRLTYPSYVNVRFKYAIAYPAKCCSRGARRTTATARGSWSAHGDAVLTVYGRYNVLKESLPRLFAEAAPGRLVTYHVLRKDWFVVSGHEKGRIFYCKTMRAKDVLRSMEFVYPERQKSYYDPIAARIARSFRGLQ